MKRIHLENSDLARLLLIALLIVCFTAFGYSSTQPTEELHADTNCRVHGGSNRHSIFIADATDPRNRASLDSFETRVRNSHAQSHRFDRVSVMHVDGSSGFSFAYDECSPGLPEECGFNENCRDLSFKYQAEFHNQLDQLLNALAVNTYAERSPLLEALHFVSVGNSFSPSTQHKSLTFITDGAQFAGRVEKALDFTRTNPDFSRLKRQHPQLFAADFTGVDVHMIFLPRRYGTRDLPNAELIKFWQLYFRDNDAQSFDYSISGRTHQ